MAYLLLTLFLLAVAAVWAILLVFMMARHLLRPPRMNDGKAMYVLKRLSPADLGMPFQEMGFTVSDALSRKRIRLAAWWITAEAPSHRTVIVLHGYSDAKVGGIAWAPLWRSLGWNVLAIDLRAHGESEGRTSTAGYYERDDIDQTISALQAEKPESMRTIVLFGVSLGAAVACGVAARRGDLAAIVLESPYPDYLSAIRSHGRRMGMPLEFAFPAALRVAAWMAGVDFDAVAPCKLIPHIACPILMIHGQADGFVPADQVAKIDAALASRTAGAVGEHAIFPGAGHTLALSHDPAGYRDRLAAFLHCAIENPPTGNPSN